MFRFDSFGISFYVGWSASPKASVLASCSTLLCELFMVCSNGVIPAVRLCEAIKSCHKTKPLVHKQINFQFWAPHAGGILRMVAAKFRDIKKDSVGYSRVIAKANKIDHRKKKHTQQLADL